MIVNTFLPLGDLLYNPPADVEFLFSESDQSKLAKINTGSPDLFGNELIERIHGSPSVVTEWVESKGFKSTLSDDADFGMAALLSILVKFKTPAEECIFAIGQKRYKRAFHSKALETSVSKLFEVPLLGEIAKLDCPFRNKKIEVANEHENLRIYFSKNPIDELEFSEPITRSHEMDLHIPFVEACHQQSFEEIKGLKAKVCGMDMKVDSCDVETRLSLNATGAEVKQMAILGMQLSACMAPVKVRQRRIEVIDGEYYCYITFNDNLMFSAKITKDDFVEGEGRIKHFASREPYIA
ncbi:hypothetical protein QTV43_000373 [Vibrio vulnificus]|nr:hypothetical protein [Vibrio vulnificus]